MWSRSKAGEESRGTPSLKQEAAGSLQARLGNQARATSPCHSTPFSS